MIANHVIPGAENWNQQAKKSFFIVSSPTNASCEPTSHTADENEIHQYAFQNVENVYLMDKLVSVA